VNVDSDVETVDVDLDDAIDLDSGIDDLDTGSGYSDKRVASMDEMEIFRETLKKGSLMFSDGRMLTSCPCKDKAAVCALYPMPHPMTGDPFMVCTGPIVAKDSKFKLMGPNETVYRSESAGRRCQYNPKRLNEEPDYVKERRRDSGSGGGGWLE